MVFVACCCVGGDFNVVRLPNQKLGGGRVSSSMQGFNALCWIAV